MHGERKPWQVASMAAILWCSVLAAEVSAAPISGFTVSSITTRDCRTPLQIALDPGTPNTCINGIPGAVVESNLQFQIGNQLNTYTSQNALAANSLGTSTIALEGVAVPGVASLKAGSFSGTDYSMAKVFGEVVQGFQYTGATSSERTIQISVSFSGSSVGSVADMFAVNQPLSSLDVGVVVFSSLASDFEYRPEADPWYQPLLSEDFVYETSWTDSGGADGQLSASLSFTMVPGRTYFIDSWILAYAKFAASMDSTHTMLAEIGVRDPQSGRFERSTTDLRLLSTGTVPEPATALLCLLALGSLGLASRRSR